jgi:hypothetical protein
MSFWANVFWANVFLDKCLSGQTSIWANVFLGKCLAGQMSSGQMASGQMSFWANVFLGKCRLGKRPSGQTLYGQMSLGKCLWANVVWANVMEPKKMCFFVNSNCLKKTHENEGWVFLDQVATLSQLVKIM